MGGVIGGGVELEREGDGGRFDFIVNFFTAHTSVGLECIIGESGCSPSRRLRSQ